VLLVALGAVVAAVPPLREAVATALRGDTGELRSELRDLGAFGVLVVLALIVSTRSAGTSGGPGSTAWPASGACGVPSARWSAAGRSACSRSA
jgi:hypothetical protein